MHVSWSLTYIREWIKWLTHFRKVLTFGFQGFWRILLLFGQSLTALGDCVWLYRVFKSEWELFFFVFLGLAPDIWISLSAGLHQVPPSSGRSALQPGDWLILLLCIYIPAPLTESFDLLRRRIILLQRSWSENRELELHSTFLNNIITVPFLLTYYDHSVGVFFHGRVLSRRVALFKPNGLSLPFLKSFFSLKQDCGWNLLRILGC